MLCFLLTLTNLLLQFYDTYILTYVQCLRMDISRLMALYNLISLLLLLLMRM